MPASTLDPVNAALRTALSKSASNSLDTQLAGSSKKALLSDIQFESAGSYQNSILDKLKSKYIVLKSSETQGNSSTQNKSKQENNMGADESLIAQYELFPLKNVQLGWNNTNWSVGAGMVNMGNTCYLNSTLQALFHVPALVNWLISDKQHVNQCEDLGGGMCIICAMRKTLQDSQQRNVNSFRPFLIYNKLKVVCRNLIPGRQEDAHEFLRYLVEAMEKAYLNRFKNHSEFDSRTKETTPLNQILGGYLRSTVRCLECGHVSTTFQHFQDLLLDIRKAQTLEEALDSYFSRETLDDESYQCEACQKKVPATKQFFVERAPMVLCIQLKRFSVSNNKITKHVQFRQRLELTKYMRRKPQNSLVYRLVAMVTHMGPTVSCGHYTAVAQAPSGNFYQFDDSMVRPISHQAVFSTNAYIMLYELEPQSNNFKKNNVSPTSSVSSHVDSELALCNNAKPIQLNGNASSKVYGPELPPKNPEIKSAIPLPPPEQNGKSPNVAVTNGNGKASLHSASSSTSSSSDSDPEQHTNKQKQNQQPQLQLQPPNSGVLTLKMPSNNIINNTTTITNTNKCRIDNNLITVDKKETDNKKQFSQEKKNQLSKGNDSKVTTTKQQLVPYDMDDSSSCSEENNASSMNTATIVQKVQESSRITTKAAGGEWKVSSSVRDNTGPSSEGKSWDRRRANVVNDLLRMSHTGYSSPVAAWNGARSQLDRAVNDEKQREERKRSMLDDDVDQGRIKCVKLNNNDNNNNGNHKANNLGYNPLQVYHNLKNWGQNNNNNNHYNRHFYNSNNRHRNGNHRNFHRNNFHKNNYRYRQ